ncbi:MAG: PilZ domain-containing protein [Deltaproteobacteria bacterium]
MTPGRRLVVHVRDPAAGGSFEPWRGRLDAEGIHFTMSHPPARRLELRFLLPGAPAEVRAEGEVIRVDREADTFVAHARLDGLDAPARAAVARFLEGA